MERPRKESEFEFVSSANDVRQFQTHVTWQDIRAYLEDRLEVYMNRLKTAEDIGNVRFLQGGIANLEDLLDLPDQIIEWVETEQDRED